MIALREFSDIDMIHEDLIIRPFEDGDAKAAFEIEQESFSDPWTCKDFENVGRTALYQGFCGEINGELCGFIIYYSLFEDAEILDIAVSEKYRRRGVGRSLIEKTAVAVKELGAERLLLEVRASNEGARELYRSMGFRETGVRRGYYAKPREDAVIMEKTI